MAPAGSIRSVHVSGLFQARGALGGMFRASSWQEVLGTFNRFDPKILICGKSKPNVQDLLSITRIGSNNPTRMPPILVLPPGTGRIAVTSDGQIGVRMLPSQCHLSTQQCTLVGGFVRRDAKLCVPLM